MGFLHARCAALFGLPRFGLACGPVAALLLAACGGGGGGKVNGEKPLPMFQITKTHSGNFQQGQQGATYTITVTNVGQGASDGIVQVNELPPAGETPVSISGSGWTAPGGAISLTRTDSLAPGQSWPPITVTVNVAPNAASPQVNMASVAGGLSPASDPAQDSTTITQVVVLTATVAPVGSLTSDQQGAQYLMQITDAGGVATSGTVTVVAPPSGFTVTAMSGAGWSCTVASVTCTYAAAVAAGQAFPAITVTGNVTESNGGAIGVPFTLSGGGGPTVNLPPQGIGVFCPAGNGPTLCGTYYLTVRGFNSSGGPHALFAGFAADAFGNISALIEPGIEVNDSVSGLTRTSIASGNHVMDASGDGRGELTLTSSAGTQTFRFALLSNVEPGPQPIEEFDSSGVLAEGLLFGPQGKGWYAIPIPASMPLALVMDGVDSAGKVNALLGALQVPASGCDGSSGSLSSITSEPVIWNAGGTVAANSDAGSCTAHMIGAAPVAGIGAVQINVAQGAPSSGIWNFDYFVIGAPTYTTGPVGIFQTAILFGTDKLDANHPALTGFLFPAGTLSGATFASGCPCVYAGHGTSDGTAGAGKALASLIRFTASSGGSNSGTVAGVVDENAAGAVTSGGAWPYTAFAIDANSVGTFTATGQPTVHFISGGSSVWTLDESAQVRSGSFSTQSATSIGNLNVPWVLGRDSVRLAGITNSTIYASGVLTPSGATSGTLTGIVDAISTGGSFPGTAVSGSYGPLAASTGRGTGSASLTGGTAVSVVIYALGPKAFLVLDAQSANPYVKGVTLQ